MLIPCRSQAKVNILFVMRIPFVFIIQTRKIILEVHTIQHGDTTVHVVFETAAEQLRQRQAAGHSGGTARHESGRPAPSAFIDKPSIRVYTSGPTKVATLTSFLKDIAREYLEYADSVRKQVRARYDYAASGKWVRICTLYENQGLQTVALCPRNEELLEEDLKAFLSNKEFYKRIGAPHVRGYLLYGKPGTGKTSLIFAIA